MIKRSISFALIYFVVRTFMDFFSGEGIDWLTNIIKCFLLFLIMLFVLWTEIPYNWNKNKDKAKDVNT